jgi:retron-type reverse transcriptase
MRTKKVKIKTLKYLTPKEDVDTLVSQLNLSLTNYKFNLKEFRYFVKNKFNSKNALHYKTFHIPKKRGDPREINAPSLVLKSIQNVILLRHLYNFRPHKSAMGFIRGKSIVNNAEIHVRKSHVYNIDLKDFFPSITSKQVFTLFRSKGYSVVCAKFITELCTLEKKLPQGAPTSPAIANMVCYHLDFRLRKLAGKCNLSYSRYADDLTFSGLYVKKWLKDKIKEIIKDEGFELSPNKEKLTKQKKKFRQEVTGLVVNRKVSIGRTKYNQLRALLHDCKKKGIFRVQLETKDNLGYNYFIKTDISDPNIDFFPVIMGHINILRMIKDYDKFTKLITEVNHLDWMGYYVERAKKLGEYSSDTLVCSQEELRGFISGKKTSANIEFPDYLVRLRRVIRSISRIKSFLSKENEKNLARLRAKYVTHDLVAFLRDLIVKQAEELNVLKQKEIPEKDKTIYVLQDKLRQVEIDLKDAQKPTAQLNRIENKIDLMGIKIDEVRRLVEQNNERVAEIRETQLEDSEKIKLVHVYAQTLAEKFKKEDKLGWEKCREKVKQEMDFFK